MAWLVTITKENKAKKGLLTMYVQSRSLKGGTYSYIFNNSIRMAKVFYNQETAKEWVADIEENDPKVITYTERGELISQALTGVSRGSYDKSKSNERKRIANILTKSTT